MGEFDVPLEEVFTHGGVTSEVRREPDNFVSIRTWRMLILNIAHVVPS